MASPARVLCIAGTDPSGGAGLLADIKSVVALGGYGMGVVTAVTVQNTQGVSGVHSIPVETIRAQLNAVAGDVEIDSVKIGMLGERAVVDAVGEWLVEHAPPNVVLDPVMVATTGGRLATSSAAEALRDLASLCHLVTPNVPELAVLTRSHEAGTIAEIANQAGQLARQVGTDVLATTGDLPGEAAFGADILVASGTSQDGSGCELTELPFVRVSTPHTHGTGCSLSSALATARVGSCDWVEAYHRVRPWMDGALRGGLTLEVGKGSGPIDHNWFLRR